jgi:hypothetical protein
MIKRSSFLTWMLVRFTENKIEFRIFPDLTSLFHWNTKQLFVFVTAEYETKANVSFWKFFSHGVVAASESSRAVGQNYYNKRKQQIQFDRGRWRVSTRGSGCWAQVQKLL